MVDDFILRKKGLQKIDYFHESLKACLTPTYGVIVYQEQVMQISQLIGRYTLGARRICCGGRWVRKSPKRWPSIAISFVRVPKQKRDMMSGWPMQLFDLMDQSLRSMGLINLIQLRMLW
jgi:DNA polymerase-3 subunit alpha